MDITLATIGKFKKTEPEQEMALDYLERAQVIGRNLGLNPIRLHEIDTKNAAPNPDKEAQIFLDNIPKNAFLIVLDENGQNLGSIELSQKIASLRDIGTKTLFFALGGADGHGLALKNRADFQLSFGKLTWPHKLCRVMAAEQIYRAVSIIAGTPYHRE
ncbi:MAG: 23S rRNA (pseudouridine(1915)-N(3))-methyltransferase RlmH [Pseudomonadota bacterium]